MTMRTLTQAAKDADITYRQAQHWGRHQYIQVSYFDRDGTPVDDTGFMVGHHAYLDDTEQRVLQLMARMVAAGVTPAAAATAARNMTDGNEADLGPGVRIRVDQVAS